MELLEYVMKTALLMEVPTEIRHFEEETQKKWFSKANCEIRWGCLNYLDSK